MSTTKNKTQEQEIRVEEKKKTEKDYLAIFDTYYKDFNVVDARHDLFEELEYMGYTHHGEKIDRPVMKVTLKSCPECGWMVKANDYTHGVVSCEHCGLVMNSYTPQEAPDNFKADKQLGSKTVDLKYETDWQGTYEYKFNKHFTESVKRLEKTPSSLYTPMKDWRQQQYFETVEIIGSQLKMNKNQMDIVKHVIDQYKLKVFHGWLGHNTIIAGICRYVLCKEGRGRELQFKKKVFKENNLTKQHYETISKNIQRYKIFGH